MGYDVTFHPFNRKEFSYFVDAVIANPTSYAEQVQKLHSDPDEQEYVSNNLYVYWAEHLDKINSGEAFESSLGFGIAGILGYLHPYWYSRGGLLSNLTVDAPFSSLTKNLANIGSEATQSILNKNGGMITGNYSSGCYIPYENIAQLLQELTNPTNAAAVDQHIGDYNIEALKQCLNYCLLHKLDLFECTDLYVPSAGECNTLPQNMRAGYKKNIDDLSNSGSKSLID